MQVDGDDRRYRPVHSQVHFFRKLSPGHKGSVDHVGHALAAHGAECRAASEWLSVAAAAAGRRQSPLEMALLLLAAKGPSALTACSASSRRDGALLRPRAVNA